MQISGVTCQHRLFAGREIQNDHTLGSTNHQVIVRTIIERGDVVGVQHTVLARVAAESVHLWAVHLQATVGSYPQVTRLICTKCVDMVVY